MKRILTVIILCSLFLTQKPVQAAAPTIKEYQNSTILDFPTSITFKADLGTDSTISKVILHYGSIQDSCGNVSGLALPDFKTGKRVNVQWEWDMRQSGGEPPGATIWWQWEIVDEQGNSAFTDRKEITWLDDIHDWQTLNEGLIRLHYYYPDSSYGTQLKDAAVKALDRLATDTGIKPDQPIDLYIYSSTQDMQDAVFYEPGWTGGLAFPEYNILIIGIDPGNLEWGKTTEAHEMTHVLVGDYTFSCLGSIPTWLSEGLAVYGEGGPDASETAYFEQNQKDDSLLTFKVLSGGFSEDPDTADLSYSQSYFMVDYLVKNYGKEKMLRLLSDLKGGTEISDSLQDTYGFNLAGFEEEWRASLGLGYSELEEAAAVLTPTIVPTVHPIQGSLTGNSVNKSISKPSRLTNQNVASSSAAFTQQSIELWPAFLPWLLIGIAVILILLLILLLSFIIRQKGEQK